MEGLERSFCLFAPLWRDGQGEENIFWESNRPIDKKLKSDVIGNGNHFLQQCNKWKSTLISQTNHANEWLEVFLCKEATANRLNNYLRGKTCQEKSEATGLFFGKYRELHFRKTGGNCQTGNKPDRAIWKG